MSEEIVAAYMDRLRARTAEALASVEAIVDRHKREADEVVAQNLRQFDEHVAREEARLAALRRPVLLLTLASAVVLLAALALSYSASGRCP